MRIALALALALVGCAEPRGASNDPIAPAELVDLNADPAIVEVSLVAEPSTAVWLDDGIADVLAYRDGSVPDAVATVPGPLLRARVGDVVIVHFDNRLDVETTIHWHGIRPPNAFDGTLSSQTAIAPGASFEYRFQARDAGTFWYHPHVAGDVQIEAGLYGAVIVEEAEPLDVAIDRVIFLDDVKLESDGNLSTRTDALDLMMGRQGNVLLVDGRADARVATSAGALERWRILNAANGRYFDLELPGHELVVIAWDGGRIAEPYATDRLLVAPGERYEVLVSIQGEVGDVLPLRTVHYDRGHDLPDPGPRTILSFRIDDEVEPQPIPDVLGVPVSSLSTDADTLVRRFVLSERSEGLPEPIFLINDEVFGEHTVIEGATGDVEIWEVVNDSEMDHPFHVHGMFFQVLGAEPLGWKDTVNVPRDSTLSFAVQLGEPGMWMYHCHILEHAERGMMGELMVMPR